MDIFDSIITRGIQSFGREFGRILLSYVRDLGFPTKVGSIDLDRIFGASELSLDDRLLKIDHARQNLAEALHAIDQLAMQATNQKAELDALTLAVSRAIDEKSVVTKELAEVKTLAALDTGAVRKALDVPTRAQRWLERLFAFAIGILASYVASLVYAVWRPI